MKALIYVTEPIAWTEEEFASYERISSDRRRRKAEKLKNLPDRVRCIGAGILLAQAYAYEKNRQMVREPAEADSLIWLPWPSVQEAERLVRECPTEAEDGNGKPYFPEKERLYFNLSHAGSFVCCCMADTPVGLDVECVRNRKETVIKRCFTPEEAGMAMESDKYFTEIWTQKEARCKLTGEGIGGILQNHLPGEVRSFWLNDTYVVSVAY